MSDNYRIGGEKWVGLAKLVEKCGEVIQVAGKLMETGGSTTHWDGSQLDKRLEEELGDLLASAGFFILKNKLDLDAVIQRALRKEQLFEGWDAEGNPLPGQALKAGEG